MGYPESTWIYPAAGAIYGGEKYISKLRWYFPNLVSKVFKLFFFVDCIYHFLAMVLKFQFCKRW
jgi:hypothetical protein